MLKVTDVSVSMADIMLEHMEFHLEQGDFFVLFGPDDSGKTELLYAILGLAGKYTGSVEVFGHERRKLSMKERKKIRFVPDEILMLYGVRVKKYLNQLARSYKIPDKGIIKELLDYFEIDAREYLTEMTYEDNKLVSLIGALITSPELLILDEPFNFLSEEMSERLLSYLRKRCDEGMTLLLASEHFEDANELANSYFYLRDGEPVKEDRIPEGWIPPKKLVIKKADMERVCAEFGEPDDTDRDAYIYIKNLSWEEIGKRITDCGIEKNVTVKTARMEEILDVEYPPKKEIPEEAVEEQAKKKSRKKAKKEKQEGMEETENTEVSAGEEVLHTETLSDTEEVSKNGGESEC